MAHFCRICHRYRPNEKFSGGGHKIHVCRNCQKRPASERARIENTDEIHGFLTQSHISEKNLGRLRALAASSDESVAGMARVVLEIGKVHPYKRKRFKFLLWKRRDLLNQLSEVGFGDIYMWFPDEVSSNEADSDETYSDEEYEALERVCAPYLKTKQPMSVLCRRVERFLPEMFMFVADPRVASDNNAAERSLRGPVVSRKISGGTRSRQGSETKSVLTSLFGTWQLRGLDVYQACRHILAAPT